MAGYGGKMNLNDERVRDLLKDLATDDEVRRAFESSPREVLEERGIEFDPAEVPDRAVLPPKKEMSATLDEQLDTYGSEILVAWAFYGPGPDGRPKPPKPPRPPKPPKPPSH